MAISWGSWSSTGANRARLGLDISVSGTKITVQYWVEVQYSVYYNGLRLARSGAISGGVTYNLNTSGGTYRIVTSSVTGSRGKSYSFSASTSITTGSGTMSPSISRSVTVPATTPSKAARPSASATGSTSISVSLGSAPSNGGASITGYQWRRATNSSFSSNLSTKTTTGRSTTFTGLSANTLYYVAVRARNSVGYGSWSDARSVRTKVASPSAPTGLTVSRSSNSRQNLSWTNRSTSGAPYANVRVLRSSSTDSTYRVIATLSGSATSYADTSTVANNRYNYRVQAVNATGSSNSSTVSIHTTPAAPTSVTATKNADDSITVRWTRNAPYSLTGHRIQDNPGGTGWVTVADNVANVSSWTHTSPDPAVSHQYRVLSKINAPALNSAYSSASNVVKILTKPLPPTLNQPSGTYARESDILFSWTHNSEDTTAQTAAEIRYRKVGSSSWTTKSYTTASDDSFPLDGTSATWEWQARTKGQHADWSDWSSISTFKTASTPSALILEPIHSILEKSELNLVWSYSDDDGANQTSWSAQLLGASGLLEERSGTSQTSTLFQTVLEDGQDYTVRVQVRSANGLWSSYDTKEFRAHYPEPLRPEISLEFDEETAAISVNIHNPPVTTYGWEGEPHNSDSIKYVDGVEVARNLVHNPSFELSHDSVMAGSVFSKSLTTYEPRVVSGSKALEINVVGDGGRYSSFYQAVNGLTGKYGNISGKYFAWKIHNFQSVGFAGTVELSPSVFIGGGWSHTWGRFLYGPAPSPGGVSPVFTGQLPEHVDGFRLNVYPKGVTGSDVVTGQQFTTDGWSFAIADTEEEALAQVEEYFDGDYDSSTNLATYGNFESYGGTGRFSTTSGIARSGTTVYHGVTATGGWRDYLPDIPIQGGGWYRISVWAYAPHTDNSYDPLGMAISLVLEDYTVVDEMERWPMMYSYDHRENFVTGEWFQISTFWRAPDIIDGKQVTAIRPSFIFPSLTSGQGADWYFDDFEVVNITPEAIKNDVYRSIDGGPWQLVAKDVPVNSAVTDHTPTISGRNTYQVVAISDIPSSRPSYPKSLVISSDDPCTVDIDEIEDDETTYITIPPAAYISAGPDFSITLKAFLALEIGGDNSKRFKELHYFSGRVYPLEFSGTALEENFNISFVTNSKGVASCGTNFALLSQWRELNELPGVVLYRDYLGSTMFASLNEVQWKRGIGDKVDMSISGTRAEYSFYGEVSDFDPENED